jgi:hypothetical protein
LAAIRVTVVTYRRPVLLERAVRSLLAQTWTDWTAEILNDDPDDPGPAALIARLADSRLHLGTPVRHRGGTANFNHAFRPGPEPYASLLEDDNWWQPEFLAVAQAILSAHPAAPLVTANERLWREEPDGSWTDTDRTLRPVHDAVVPVPFRALDHCGHAQLANSGLLFRTTTAASWRTPDSVPIDVTEHYRQRAVPHPFLRLDRALVNFALTRHTHRSTDPFVWNSHQTLLVASVFAAAPAPRREGLATALLTEARRTEPRRVTTLALAGRYVPAAAALWRQSHLRERARSALHLLRHRGHARRYRTLLTDAAPAWNFLRRGWVADALARGEGLPA